MRRHGFQRGYYCGRSRVSGHEEADGILGEKSNEAVKSFQKKTGITADGVVGAETWKGASDNLTEPCDN